MKRAKKAIWAIFALVLALGILGDWPLREALMGRWKTPFYQGELLSEEFLTGRSISLPSQHLPQVKEGNSKGWRKFLIAQHFLDLPYGHPYYRVAFFPAITDDGGIGIGVNYLSTDGHHLLSFKLLAVPSFPGPLHRHLLFKLPRIQGQIEQWSLPEIWRDLFLQDISIAPFHFAWRSPKDILKKFYLAHQRSRLFGHTIQRLGFFAPRELGVLSMGKSSEGYGEERIFMGGRNQIFVFAMSSLNGNSEASLIRTQILQSLSHQRGGPHMAQVIYKEFQALPQKHKVSERGMLYLISAWSQEQENPRFLHQAISFLEKGRGHLIHLSPLQQFAREHYGKDFSTGTKDKAAHAKDFEQAPLKSTAERPNRDVLFLD